MVAEVDNTDPGGKPTDTSVSAGLLGSSDPEAIREMPTLYLTTEAETPDALLSCAAARDSVGLCKVAHAGKGAASSAEIDAAFADAREFIEAF